MLIERLVMYEKKRVVLFVPKSGRVPVWERNIKRYLPHLLNGFLSFKIFNHTDLMRGVDKDGLDYPAVFAQMKEQADVVVIDEAHHFRNRGLSREVRRFALLDALRSLRRQTGVSSHGHASQ